MDEAVLPTGKTQISAESARLLQDAVDDVFQENVGPREGSTEVD